MKKSFLLLLLLTLLPFSAWAVNYGQIRVTWNNPAAGTYNAADQALPNILNVAQYNDWGWQTLPTSAYTIEWTYSGSDVVVARNAGEYTARITPTSGNSFTAASGYSLTHTWQMNRANNTISEPAFVDGDSWEYGQAPHAPSATALDGTVTFQWYGQSGWTAWPVPDNQKPGTYYIRAHVAQTLNYNERYSSGNATFTITKALVTIVPGNETAMWRDPFTGVPMDNIANATVTGALTNWSDAKSYLQWSQVDPVTVAEKGYAYTLESNGTTSDYYNFVVSGNGTVNITKNNTGALKNVSNGADQVYDGTAKTLTPGGTIVFTDDDNNEAGTIEYRIIAPTAAATDWAEAVPTATNAETYTVEVRGVGDENHEDAAATETYTVFIDKATTPLPVITAVGGPFTYKATIDESAFTVTAESDGTLSYTYDFKAPGASGWTTGVAFDGSAGTWKVYAHQTEGTNWYALDDVTGFEFTVGKANDEFTTAPAYTTATLTYDAAAHELLTNYATVASKGTAETTGEVQYKVDYTPNVGTAVAGTYSTAEPKGTEAGKYTIYCKVVETDPANYNEIAEFKVGEVTIAKAPVVIFEEPAGKDDLVYNNADQQLLKRGVTVYFNGAKVTPIAADYTMGSDTWNGWAQPKAKDAGTYTITCQVKFTETAHKNNFIVPDPIEVKATIAKAGLDIAAQDIEVNWTGTAIDLPASHYAKGDPTDFNGESEDEQYAIVNSLVQLAWIGEAGNTAIPTDAGYYKFELALVGTDPTPCNYKINNFSPTASLQINKVDATPATVAKAELTYNGTEQALLTVAGEVKGGTMLYFVGDAAPGVGDSKWETAVPKKKDAGTYKVWYMTKGDNNHNDIAAKSEDVTIAKKALDIAMFEFVPGTLKTVYNGENQLPTFAPIASEPITDADWYFEFEDGEGNPIADPNTGVKDVDTYAIIIKAEADGNYKGEVSTTWDITKKPISDADVKFALETATVQYDGADHKADVKVVPTAPLTAADYTVVTPTEMKNQGEYTITLNAKADGNYSGSTTAKFTITKKPLNASFFVLNGENPVIFDGTDQIPGFELLATEPIVAADFTFATTNSKDEAVTEMVDADTYTYTFTASAAGNYSGEVTVDFVINQATAEFVDPVAEILTYNGTEQSLISEGFTDAVAGVVDPTAGKVEYKVEFDGETFIDWTEDYASILAKNAGTYTVSYKFTASELNYTNPEVTGSFDVKILQANVKYRMGKQVETYTGEAFEPVEGEAYTLAAGGLFVGDEDVITFSFEEGFDATTACEEGRPFTKLVYTFKDDIANYTVDFQNEGLLIIKKAAIADYTAPVANDLTFNGLSQKLVTAGSVNEIVDEKPLGTIMFSTSKDGKGEYTTDVPEGTDAKDYDVWFKVVGDANHSDSEPAKVADVKIKPFALFADMIKAETLSKPYTAAVQSFPMSLKVKLAADKKDPRTLVDNQDYTVKINDKEVKDVVIKNAGAYVYTFTGKGNYTGTISTTATITKGELIATAPNAVKTYDGTAVIEPEEFECTATQLKLYGGLEISGLLADDKIDLGDKTIADIIVPEGSAINVGEYNLKVNLAAIPVQANYTFNAQTFNGKLTINKAEAVKIGFFTWEEPNTEEAFWGTTIVKTKEYSKSYATADPVFITEKGTNDVTSISGDLMALEGELFEDNAVVATLLGATRTAGEVYTKDGYTVKLGWKNTSNTAELAKIATFKNNYKNVTFGTTKLNITPFAGTIKVSIKSMATTFDGNDHAGDCTWAADLSNMVVVGMPAGKNKNEIFTELPKITVTPKDGKVRNAGDYNITLSGGKSDNYDMKKVQFVLGSYLTVEPFEITPDMVTIPDQQVKIGDKAKDVIKHDAFTFAEGALPVAEDAGLFQVVAAPDFIDANGKIKLGADPAEGLILARKDNTNAEALNYTGYDEVFGYLSIIGTPDLLVLDDTKDIATKDRENTDVTFTNRSIRQDDWNVLCLPFDATIKEISDAFGYAAVDLLKKESVDGSMHFVVTTSGTVPAGEPFIIKPTSDPELDAKSNFVQVKFTGVTVKEFSDNPEPVKDSAGNKFCGTFKAQTTFFGEKFWYMSKGEWKQASNYTEANPVKLGAYRAYIETATAGARIFIEEPDGTITAINAIDLNNNTMDEGWYTVNGMKLNAAPTQKGTYIKDGKKVFVK